MPFRLHRVSMSCSPRAAARMGAEKSAAPVTADLPFGQPLVAETPARYATDIKYEDIPAAVVREAKRYLIDSIGCGLGGCSAEPSEIANWLAANVSAVRGATVMCSGVVTAPGRSMRGAGMRSACGPSPAQGGRSS